MVKPDELEFTPPPTASAGSSSAGEESDGVATVAGDEGARSTASIPKHLAFGLTPDTASHLLHTLPELSTKLEVSYSKPFRDGVDKLTSSGARGQGGRRIFNAYDYSRPTFTDPQPTPAPAGTSSADRASAALMKIIDLRNANAGGIAFENRRRIVEAFSEPNRERKGPDTGRAEVQGISNGLPCVLCANRWLDRLTAALLTAQIRTLWDHLSEKTHRHDIHARRALQLLVHQRAKILKYLRSKLSLAMRKEQREFILISQ